MLTYLRLSCLLMGIYQISCAHIISFSCALFSISKKSILNDFLLTVKAATLKFISGHGSAISSAK